MNNPISLYSFSFLFQFINKMVMVILIMITTRIYTSFNLTIGNIADILSIQSIKFGNRFMKIIYLSI